MTISSDAVKRNLMKLDLYATLYYTGIEPPVIEKFFSDNETFLKAMGGAKLTDNGIKNKYEMDMTNLILDAVQDVVSIIPLVGTIGSLCIDIVQWIVGIFIDPDATCDSYDCAPTNGTRCYNKEPFHRRAAVGLDPPFAMCGTDVPSSERNYQDPQTCVLPGMGGLDSGCASRYGLYMHCTHDGVWAARDIINPDGVDYVNLPAEKRKMLEDAAGGTVNGVMGRTQREGGKCWQRYLDNNRVLAANKKGLKFQPLQPILPGMSPETIPEDVWQRDYKVMRPGWEAVKRVQGGWVLSPEWLRRQFNVTLYLSWMQNKMDYYTLICGESALHYLPEFDGTYIISANDREPWVVPFLNPSDRNAVWTSGLQHIMQRRMASRYHAAIMCMFEALVKMAQAVGPVYCKQIFVDGQYVKCPAAYNAIFKGDTNYASKEAIEAWQEYPVAKEMSWDQLQAALSQLSIFVKDGRVKAAMNRDYYNKLTDGGRLAMVKPISNAAMLQWAGAPPKSYGSSIQPPSPLVTAGVIAAVLAAGYIVYRNMEK